MTAVLEYIVMYNCYPQVVVLFLPYLIFGVVQLLMKNF